MISDELRIRIRRLFYAEHWRIGTIASELRVHPDTVAQAIEKARFSRPASRVVASKLDPFKAFIEETLEKHPRLRATRLFDMIRDRGYHGSVVQLRRYVGQVRPRSREAFLRLTTYPGEQGQVDWGSFGKLRVGHADRSLSCFVMVLSWSRALFARFALDQTLESFIRGHVRAFDAFRGVPRSLLYDNLKSVVLDRDGDHVRFHPHILELAGHYHFAPKPCAPYRGNEKGKVERTIQFIRHSFFDARRFADLDDLNAQLDDWTERIAHARPVPQDPSRRPISVALDEERIGLLPLPEHPFGTDHVRTVCSGKTPFVRFDLNDYSIPHDLVRQPLTLIASEAEIRVAESTGKVVARHVRSYDRGRTVADPSHIEELAVKKRHARELSNRDRLRQTCSHAEAFLSALAVRGDSLRNEAAQLTRLIDRYGPLETDAAIADALERQAVSAAAVAHVLDQRQRRRHAPPPLDVILPDDPRVRDVRVIPHALAPYDALGKGVGE